MTAKKTLQTSLEQFGEVAKSDGVTEGALMMALYRHALTSNTELNPKASKRAIRAHWGVKVQYRDKVRTFPLAKHYEFVTSKLKGFTGNTNGQEVLDQVVADGQLHRTRFNWIGLPDAFGNENTAANEPTADEVL